MSEKIVYHEIIDPEVLTEAIALRIPFSDVCTGIKTRYPKPSDENQDTYTEIHLSRTLTSEEHDQITAIINALGPSYDLQIRKGIEKNVMVWAMEQGHLLLRQFAANNIYRQKTPEQLTRLLDEKCLLITSLMTGSLTIAYSELSATIADEDFSQEEIDEFKLRLEIALGI